MPDTLERQHRTQSLYEGAYLLARGFKLAGKERTGQKVAVIFESHPDLAEAVMSFYNGGRVEGKVLFDAYRTLKDFVFER